MKINVPEKYADLYLKALTEKKKALEKRIEEFKKEIDEIDLHINTLTSLPIFQDQALSTPIKWDRGGYRAQWPWTRKIGHLIGMHNALIQSSEVVTYILEHEPALDKSRVRSSVSAALSNKVKIGEYRKFIDPVTTSAYYGLQEWFDAKDQPLLEYLPHTLKQRLTA